MKVETLKGKWILQTWTHRSKATQQIFLPFGEKPKGYISFTEDKFLSEAHKDPNTHHDETPFRHPLYEQSTQYISLSGLYQLNDNCISFEYQESSIDNLVSKKREREISIQPDGILFLHGETIIDDQVFIVEATFKRENIS